LLGEVSVSQGYLLTKKFITSSARCPLREGNDGNRKRCKKSKRDLRGESIEITYS
jgi:hypothetical protein